MSNLLDKFLPIVNDINSVFYQLKNRSNDELRNEFYRIEQNVNKSDSKSKAQDLSLVNTFAIVKEVARRFSEGNIIVQANSYDKFLSENFDFVSINGNNAIYKNRWDVGGVPFQWNMVHYDEQLLGGIMLHFGYAIEMATGEGKTLVATLPVLLNALTHEGVHLMTVNDYLSKRDFQITRPLYMFLGLRVDCIECYSLYDKKRRKDAYKADITFGTNSSFTFDYLYDHLAIRPEDCVQQKHHFAIIDEIDSILIDEADTPHIVGGGEYYNDGAIYKENLPIVKELIESENSQTLYQFDKLTHSASFTINGKKWLSEKKGAPDLFENERTYQIENFDLLEPNKRQEILEKLHLQNALIRLLEALTVYERDVDYIVDGNRIIIIDNYTGRAKPSQRWEHGLHTAIEVKESVEIRDDFNGIAVISLKNYFKLYEKVSGMSGTVLPVADELLTTYGLNSITIPTHLPMIRVDEPLRVFRTMEQKDEAIIDLIIKNHQAGRPSLVGCLNIKRSEHISNLLADRDIDFNRLDAKTTKEEAITVAKAGIGNAITVSTSVGGRGTDIKPSDDAITNGGLLVIGTDLFDSVRVDRQLKGRSGRQGNPGTSVFFVSLEDVILKNLSEEDRQALLSDVESAVNEEQFTIRALPYFKKAQANREDYLKECRENVAKKDDIIAPHRLTFYSQRNKLLYDASESDGFVNLIIQEHSVSSDSMNDHLKDLYLKTKQLVIRSLRNNRNIKIISVPFSENRHPYAILLNTSSIVDETLGFNYFSQEYKRQISLRVFDNYWKDFVMYIMEELDNNEIQSLDTRYTKMMTNIKSTIIRRLMRSTILFSEVYKKEQRPNERVSRPLNSNIILPDSPCPCGSQKKFCECHGRNIRRKRRR